MDQLLFNAWKAEQLPFNGETLCCSDLVLIADMQPIVKKIVSELNVRFGKQELNQIDDWHEHDGYVTVPKPISWNELESVVSSSESLYQSRRSDEYVRLAVYPKNREFLFRLYVLDENSDPDAYPGRWVDFDLTSSPVIIGEIFNSLSGAHEKIVVQSALKYFGGRYAG